MKNIIKIEILIFLLFFNFQSFTKADDIREFQIEGMSIGESALKYFDEQYIKNGINHKNTFKYKDNKFVTIPTLNNYKNYDDVGLVIMPNDKNFTIYALEGTLNYGNKINNCYKK